MRDKVQRFSIRKFSVGVGSILVGTTIMFGLNQQVQAEEVIEENVEQETEEVSTEDTDDVNDESVEVPDENVEVPDENVEVEVPATEEVLEEEVSEEITEDESIEVQNEFIQQESGTPHAELYDVETEQVYIMFRNDTTEEDVLNAISIPNYEGEYSVEIISDLPRAMINRDHTVEVVVTFEDGSTTTEEVIVAVLSMGPSPVNTGGTVPVLTVDDELPNPEDYIANIDEIRAYYDQYDMEVTVEWGQAFHSKQDLIDHYFGEDTNGATKRILTRVLVDDERLFLNGMYLVVEAEDVPEADLHEVETEHVYKQFRSATTEEDILNAISLSTYEGEYTVEINDRLPGSHTPNTYEVGVTVTFEDGSTKDAIVPVTVLSMGPRPENIPGVLPVLTVDDEIPSPEDYITNMDEIRAFYEQYGMEVTVEWGQAYHSKQDLIDNYFGEATNGETKRILNRIVVDGERLWMNYIELEIEEVVVPDADLHEVETEHVYKMFRNDTTEEDILNAISIPTYKGEYSVEIISDLPRAMINRDHTVEVVITFEDGSTTTTDVTVTVLGMGPSAQIIDNPIIPVLTVDDEIPNAEDYVANLDEIKAYYEQYGMEVTAVWGQAYHSKEDLINNYFGEATDEDGRFTLIRILVDGERLFLKTFKIVVEAEEEEEEVEYNVPDHVLDNVPEHVLDKLPKKGQTGPPEHAKNKGNNGNNGKGKGNNGNNGNGKGNNGNNGNGKGNNR